MRVTRITIIAALLSIVVPSANASIIGWGVAGNTLAKSTDGGNTWTNFASNAGFGALHGGVPYVPMVYAVASPDPSDIWIAGEQGLIMHSANGGLTWNTQSSLTSQDILRLRFVDANNGWAVGANGTIVHTVDGGGHWTVQPSGTAAKLLDVRFVDAQNGWAVGTGTTILHTSNAGATWTVQNAGTTLGIDSIYFTDLLNGWAVGGQGNLLHTSNGGASWAAQNGPFGAPGSTDELEDLVYLDPLHGWVTGFDGVGFTADGGNTWSTYLTNQTGFDRITFINPQVGWVADSGILWLTTNGGANWTRKNSGFTFNDITFLDTNAVPEPSSLMLIGMAAPWLLARRRRNR
jgi:photosystem II stability/assembly factor-like uncharacterized protein